MATLQQLGVTLGVGCGILATTLVLFAGAVRLRITHIAPRCEARPRNVIYNSDPYCDESQNRGNPFLLGWVFWTLRLSYHTLLQGVPGTGTREGGLSGHLLRTNLDMIVLLRFHALALKIATFAMIVYCGVAMPVYYTARCFTASYDTDVHPSSNCTDDESYNMTQYERITLAHVPPLTEAAVWETGNRIISFRLYVVVFCSYIVCWYTCYEVLQEWIDLLALRRVYYLEYDLWKGSQHQLSKTVLSKKQDRDASDQDPHMNHRESWIPHPELNDTPPNIGLYSVLVGGLPNRPRQAALDEEAALNAAEDEGEKLDWQLSVTSAFFDYCVPNQPGFSSSVAAVTILPSAAELAEAWRKFYRATKRLSRLRFIRRKLLERYEEAEEYESESQDGDMYEEDSDDDSYEDEVQNHRPGLEGAMMDESARRKQYTTEILGSITDEDVEALFLQSLRMGPEQTAVYSREMARSVANCCPHGCCEEEIYFADVQKLLRMEASAKEAAKEAYAKLEEARKTAALAQEMRNGMRAEIQDTNKRAPAAMWFDASSLEFTEPSPAASKKNTGTDMESRIYKRGQVKRSTSSRALFNLPSPKDSNHSLNTQDSLTPPTPVQSTSSPFGGLERQDSCESFKSAISHIDPSESSKHAKFSQDDDQVFIPPLPRPRSLFHDYELESSSHAPSSILKPTSWASSMIFKPDPLSAVSEKDLSSHAPTNDIEPWEIVELVATEAECSASRTGTLKRDHRVDDGVWHWPTLKMLRSRFVKKIRNILTWGRKTTEEVTDLQARDSTFAVVTFTSRQAAVAARRCLSDGRGAGRWTTMEGIPTPPLADASAFNICDCRGCMRPVTVTLNEQQKVVRNYLALGMVAFIYIFYTYPITWAATYGSENTLALFDAAPELKLTSDKLYGFIRAQLLNLFLALCPGVFMAIANFGSNATSMVGAEFAALQYYWWFMVLFALLSSSFFQMTIRSAREDGSLNFIDNFQTVAQTIPSEVSATWANWIVLKFTIFHPMFYLLQLHTFLFSCLGFRCCARLVRGGGSGNKMPYRIYVESGVVLMCTLALAPAAPIIAPFAVMYFLVCTPLLRYVVIFTYKPQWDAGGIRWPFLADMIISSLLASQLLLTTMMALKRAPGAATLACILCVPTIVFRQTCRNRFLQAYNDAALLQTSQLDGWDTTEKSSMKEREDFRQFLVDTHKAAYVPACIAGTNTDKIITAEPAVVVPVPTDVDCSLVTVASDELQSIPESSASTGIARAPPVETVSTTASTQERRESFMSSQQVGAVMRRSSVVFAPSAVPGNRQAGTHLSATERTATISSNGSSSLRAPSFGKAWNGNGGKRE